MIRPTLYLIVIQLAATFSLATGPQNQDEERAKHFFRELWKDQQKIWTAPVREDSWRSTQTFFILGTSAASFSLDGDPSRRLQENESLDGFNDILSSDAFTMALTAFPFAVVALAEAVKSPNWTSYGWRSARAVVDASLVVYALKAATGRARPHTGEIYGFWEGGNSYPSGHSMVAWSLAAVTVEHFKQHKWIPWVAYPVAGLIAFSRVSGGHHFASDVVTGAGLGFAIGHHVGRQ